MELPGTLEEAHAEIVELRNREHFLRQELALIVEDSQDVPTPEDAIHLGEVAGQDYYLNLRTLQRSACLFGRQGSGKSNMAKLLTRELHARAISTIVFDYSGEFRKQFQADDIIEPDMIGINPFDDLGSWSDNEVQAFVQNGFFSFMDATKRSAVNQGAISKLIHQYFQHYPAGARTLGGFRSFLSEYGEVMRVNRSTLSSIEGYIDKFLYDPQLAGVFTAKQTHPAIRRAITGDGNACVVLAGLHRKVQGIAVISIMRQIAYRYEMAYLQSGTTGERPLSRVLILEETVNMINGQGERDFLENFLRVSRKWGLSACLFARGAAGFKALGVGNLVEEVGLLAFFPLNEYLPLRNTDLSRALKSKSTTLRPGQAVMFQDGETQIVSTRRFTL